MKKSSAILAILATLALSAAPVFALADTITFTPNPILNSTLSDPYPGGSATYSIDGIADPDGVHVYLWFPADAINSPSEITDGTDPIDDYPLDFHSNIDFYSYIAGTFNIHYVVIGQGFAANHSIDCSTLTYSQCAVLAAGDPDLLTGFVPFINDSPTPRPPIAILPSGSGGNMLAVAEATVSNPGVLEVVALAAGVYISFYVLRQLIALAAQRRGNNKGRQN